MEGKKISFGFTKTKKVEKPAIEEKKEFIECLEEQSIKVVGGETVEEKPPLVIEMKPNTLITKERLKQIAEEVESAVLEPDVKEEQKSSAVKEEPREETIEQMAVRELLQEAKKEVKVESPGLVLLVPAQPKLEGQKESTLDDYESVPIQEFGLAMLRGMGWAPGKEQSKYKEPQLRPKGLGLGADTVLKKNQKKSVDKDGKELLIVKNACVKITTGKYKGCYGKVVSLDEDNGRVMVDIPLKKQTVSLSEFMMMAVTKSEFDMQSRVINAEKYDEYKKKEQAGHRSSKHESPRLNERESTSWSDDVSSRDRGRKEERSNREREPESSSHRGKDSDNPSVRNKESEDSRSRDQDSKSVRSREPDSSNGRYRDRDYKRDSSSSEDRSKQRKKDKRRYSSHESLSSESESDRQSKSKKDARKRKSSTESDSSDGYGKHKKNKKHKRGESPQKKRDIDKKRKGKKKRRDRDRSPNYKKHRK